MRPLGSFPTGRPAAPGSGSEGHYEQDFLAFSKWGFDFVKVDWCGGDKEGLDAPTAYKAIADAIKKACKTCHDKYEDKFKEEHRTEKLL